MVRELTLDDHTYLLLQQREAELGWQPWYFPGRFSGHVHPATIAKWVRPYIAPYPLHSLRRRAGTNGHRATRDICAVQHLLGHASLETTQRYVKTTPDEIAKVILANSLGAATTERSCICNQMPPPLIGQDYLAPTTELIAIEGRVLRDNEDHTAKGLRHDHYGFGG